MRVRGRADGRALAHRVAAAARHGAPAGGALPRPGRALHRRSGRLLLQAGPSSHHYEKGIRNHERY